MSGLSFRWQVCSMAVCYYWLWRAKKRRNSWHSPPFLRHLLHPICEELVLAGSCASLVLLVFGEKRRLCLGSLAWQECFAPEKAIGGCMSWPCVTITIVPSPWIQSTCTCSAVILQPRYLQVGPPPPLWKPPKLSPACRQPLLLEASFSLKQAHSPILKAVVPGVLPQDAAHTFHLDSRGYSDSVHCEAKVSWPV